MKLKEILNEYNTREPASVEYEMLFDEDTDEPVYKTIEIIGNMISTSDPFGTGDSPEEQEFEPERAIVKDTGEPFSLENIPKEAWQSIVDRAVSNYNRFR